MKTQLLLVLTLAVSACTTTPSAPSVSGAPQVPVNFMGCSSTLPPAWFPDSGNATAVLILLGLEASFEIAAYGTCTVERLAHPSATGTVTDGVFRSGHGTFSVALPFPPPGIPKPSIAVIQPTVLPSESVLFRSMDDGDTVKSGAMVFGAAMSRETQLEQSATVEQAGIAKLDRENTAVRAGAVAPTLIRHELVTLDGRPALFASYESKLYLDGKHATPAYLFVYFTRYQNDSAVLTVLWSGDCLPCASGHEAGIRALDPNIGRFVDSFHMDEKALLAWDAANPLPADKPAPPALPSIPVPDGKALVYFYRESHFAGGGLTFHLSEAGNELGTLPNGTYLHTLVDPGTHAFVLTTWGTDDDPCPLQVMSGETRYVEVFVIHGATGGQSILLGCRESPELETRTKMAGLKESTDD